MPAGTVSARAWRLSAVARSSPPVAPRAARSCRPELTATSLATISLRRDFLAANKGRRIVTPGFILLINPRRDDSPEMRAGYTVTKKIGGAVIRNRMKRRLRELARDLVPQLGQPGADHVLIGREAGIERDFIRLRTELENALMKVKPASGPVSR